MKKKKVFLFLLSLASFINSYADIADCTPIKEENARALNLLTTLTELDMNKTYLPRDEKGKKTYDFKDEKALIDAIDNPMEMAKVILISDILSNPDIHTEAIDRHYDLVCNISLMKKFIGHKDFLKAMKYIESRSTLSGCRSHIFSEVLWEARHIEAVKKQYAKRIVEIEKSKIMAYGTDEDKKAYKAAEHISKLWQKTRAQIIYGDYDGARRSLFELKNLSPDDEPVEYFLKFLEERQESVKAKTGRQSITANGCTLL